MVRSRVTWAQGPEGTRTNRAGYRGGGGGCQWEPGGSTCSQVRLGSSGHGRERAGQRGRDDGFQQGRLKPDRRVRGCTRVTGQSEIRSQVQSWPNPRDITGLRSLKGLWATRSEQTALALCPKEGTTVGSGNRAERAAGWVKGADTGPCSRSHIRIKFGGGGAVQGPRDTCSWQKGYWSGGKLGRRLGSVA